MSSGIFTTFLRLGLTSFGGPIAHLGYFREEFVVRRAWLSEAGFAQLLAIAQALPGPASSQVGLALVAEQALRMVWGSAPLASNMPPEFKGNVMLGDFMLSKYRLFILAVVMVVMTGIWLLMHKTAFGRVVRAGVQKPDMVAALGIKLQPYMTAIVVLGVATAALGGVLFGPIAIVHPAMGMEIMTVAFVVVVIGGLGSFWGVVAAALLVGVVRGITTHFMPAASEASMYVLMFLVLMFRPRGLLGERIERFE